MASQIAAAQKDYRLDYGIGATCQVREPGAARLPARRPACHDKISRTLAHANLNPHESLNAQADVERECKGELEHLADGGGAELRCLVRSFKRLAGGCQDELARGVRQALWAYRAGAPLTRMCDADVKVRGRGGTGGIRSTGIAKSSPMCMWCALGTVDGVSTWQGSCVHVTVQAASAQPGSPPP